MFFHFNLLNLLLKKLFEYCHVLDQDHERQQSAQRDRAHDFNHDDDMGEKHEDDHAHDTSHDPAIVFLCFFIFKFEMKKNVSTILNVNFCLTMILNLTSYLTMNETTSQTKTMILSLYKFYFVFSFLTL